MSKISIKTVSPHVSTWGEGPLWWQDALLFVDIEGCCLNRLNPENGQVTSWNVRERIGTVVPTSDKKFAYAGDNGFVRFDPYTNTKTPMGNPEGAMGDSNRFNDGKCDPSGRFWAGSISLKKEEGTANLYMLDRQRRLHFKLGGLTNSNGICWSPDASTLYHIDTPTKVIRAFEFDLQSGALGVEQTIIDTRILGYDSSPDGMCIDADGNLWVAFCHGGCVACFDPRKQSKLHHVDFPCVETTACTFGGPKLDRLFVTTGIHKSKKETHAGKVFVVDGLGVKGLPAYCYDG
jgi:sugar lactone lactonase YvrE